MSSRQLMVLAEFDESGIKTSIQSHDMTCRELAVALQEVVATAFHMADDNGINLLDMVTLAEGDGKTMEALNLRALILGAVAQ